MGKRKAKQKKQAKKKTEMKKMKHTTVNKAGCHTGQRLIFTTHEGIEVWAGGKNRNGGWHKMNPFPELAMGPSETMRGFVSSDTEVPEGWTCERALTKETPPLFVAFDWPDFSIPHVSAEFWYAMITDIRTHGIKSISTQCAGGHGRTGVQLAILRYLLGTTEVRACYPTAADLIDWVRDKHCDNAVEAKSQQEYIADVCQIPAGESKIHSTGMSWTKPSSNYNYWGSDMGKAMTPLDVTGFDIGSGLDVCPCCKADYSLYCDECGYDAYEDMQLKFAPCLNCGTNTHDHEMELFDGTSCMFCHGMANKYKVTLVNGDTSSTCITCKRALSSLCFTHYDSKRNGLQCYGCNSGLYNKGDGV